METPKRIRTYFLKLLILFAGVALAQSAEAQIPANYCFGGTKIGDITPTIPWQVWPCVRGGEYLEFNAVAGNQYIFTFCFAGGAATWDTQLSISDSAGNFPAGYNPGTSDIDSVRNDDFCYLQSYLVFPCRVSGTYRILTSFYDGILGPCQTSNQCGALAYKVEPPRGGVGDNCANPHVIPSLPFTAGGLTTRDFANDYNQTHACNSTYMNGLDYVFSYNGTAGECISIFTQNTFTYSGLFLLDGCPDDLSTNCVAFTEAGSGNPFLSNITLDSTKTYYIVISSISGLPYMPFDINVTNCVAVGIGNTCANPFPIPGLPYSQQGFTTCGFGDDYDNTNSCPSPYMNGEDFVFRYTSPGNECIRIDLRNTDLYTGFFVYEGCPTTTNCVAEQTELGGNPRLRRIDLVNAGDYYIVVSTQPNPNCTPFDIEISQCPPECNSNPNGSDLCSQATLVSLGPNDTVCGFTNELYGADASIDLLNDFCGTIENNTWFTFVADSTTMTFVAEAGNCLSGFGIQAEVFFSSDCINFTSVSDCWNPMLATTGIFQANNLIVGNSYYLMLDGYAGDDCEFLLYRRQGPLPIEFGPFTANLNGSAATLNWETFMESNNRGFVIERGQQDGLGETDHILWEDISFVKGLGDTEDGHIYSYVDEIAFNGRPYFYRLRQLDYNGQATFSEIRSVNPEGPNDSRLLALYPNPVKDWVNLTYFSHHGGAVSFQLVDLKGQLVMEQAFEENTPGVYEHRIHLSQLAQGLYLFNFQVGAERFTRKINISR